MPDVARLSLLDEFKRTQTITQGAAYCDFRYRFK
jgi:hypothetical protein